MIYSYKRIAVYGLAFCALLLAFHSLRNHRPNEFTHDVVETAESVIELAEKKETFKADPDTASAEPARHGCTSDICSHCFSKDEASQNQVPVPSVTVSLADTFFEALADLPERERTADASIFDDLSESMQGQSLQLTLGPLSLSGVASARKVAPVASSYSMELLGDVPGRLIIHRDGNGELSGQVFFYGDSRVVEIGQAKSKENPDELTLRQVSVADVLCAPPGSFYTRNGIRLAEGVGSRFNEPDQKLYPPIIGQAAPIELENKAGADYVIYLDFDGENVVDHFYWGDINAQPHPRVNDSAFIQKVWRRVVEDFAAFDINITTDRSVFDQADVDKRLQVIITPTDDAAPLYGGVALIGSFRENSPICWVFHLSEYRCATTISHEVGHTMGLLHDGKTDGTEYYGGHNNGYTHGWAPIMGAPFKGFYDEVDSWSKGEYAGANRLEDDIAIIASINNGFGRVEDDYTNVINASNVDLPFGSLVTKGGDLHRGAGVISRNTDVDLFVLSMNDGAVEITVSPLDVGSTGVDGADTQGANLAVDTRLFSVDGTEIAVGLPYGSVNLASRLETTVTAGTYYLAVSGGGRGVDPFVGFSDYASLGEYTIAAKLPPRPLIVFGGDKYEQIIPNQSTEPQEINDSDFGFSYPGGRAITKTFLLTNQQTTQITNLTISFDKGEDFSQDTSLPVRNTIQGNSSTKLRIQYKAHGHGLNRDTLIIRYNSGGKAEEYRFAVGGTSTRSATQDNYETNNYSTQAYDLSRVEDIWLSEYKGKAFFKSSRRDFYSFTVKPDDDLITINIDYDDTDAKLTFKLFNHWGVEFLSTSKTDGELRYLIPTNFSGLQRKFYIRAETSGTAWVRSPYNLRWSAIPFDSSAEDPYENNNSQREAYDLTDAPKSMLSEGLGKGVLNDDDWYKITIPPNPHYRMLHIAATFEHDEGDINIEVFKEGWPFFNNFRTSSSTQKDKEVVTISRSLWLSDLFGKEVTFDDIVSGIVPDTYYIRVYGDNAGNQYDLTVEPLPDDKYEFINKTRRHNSPANAYNLGDEIIDTWLSEINGAGTIATYGSEPVNVNGPFSYGQDIDFYRIDLSSAGDVAQLNLDFRSYSSPLRVALLDASGNVKALSRRAFSTQLNLDSVPDDTYYVRILTEYYFDALSNYDFRVTLTENPPPIEGAKEDSYEENDNFEQLYDLRGNAGYWLTSIDGYGVHLDPDWYEIYVPEGAAKLIVRASFDSNQGNIDLVLSRKDGPVLFQSKDGNNEEEIIWENPTPGPYAVTIIGNRNGNSYNLFWDVVRTDDEYEQNNSRETAYDLSSSEGIWLSKLQGEGVQRNADWYKITVPAGNAQIRIQTNFDPKEGDIDLDLYDANEYLVARSVSNTEIESIAYDTTVAGDYYILVHHGNAGNEYDLLWSALTEVELDIIEFNQDAYEDNNSRSEAFLLENERVPLSELPEGLAIQADDDWYQIVVNEKNIGLAVTCSFSHAEGDIDIELVDSRGTSVVRRNSLTDNENFVFNAPLEKGDYYLRVYGANEGNQYDLNWHLRLVDEFESNDTRQTAFNLTGNIGKPLSTLGKAVQGEDDWYRVDVQGDYAHLFVQLDYVHTTGNIDFEIFNSGGTRIHQALDSNNSTSAFIPVSVGTYYIRIFGDDQFNRYDLLVDVRHDDIFEQNDVRSRATDIIDRKSERLIAAQFDDDWYLVEITEANSTVAVSSTYLFANGDIDITLYDEDGNQLAQSTGVPTAEQLADPNYVHTETLARSVSTGKYYVQISGANRNQEYAFAWIAKPDDVNDNGTGNDRSGNPTTLPSINTPVDGIQFDDDWYIVSVPFGHVLLDVKLTTTHPRSDLDLEVYDANMNLMGSAKNITNNETLRVGVSAFGRNYLIRVYGNNFGNDYKISWSSTDVDAYENNGNNVFDKASTDLLGLESTYLSDANGLATLSDEDWYRIELAQGDNGLIIQAEFIATLGNIDIELFNSSQVRVGGSTGNGDSVEYIHYQGASGIYYIRVFGDLAGNAYDLIWNSYKEDELEIWNQPPVQNDTFNHANAVEFLELVPHENLTQADEDWYKLDVLDGETLLLIRCEFIHVKGDINLSLYKSSNLLNPVATASASSIAVNFEEIQLANPAAGSYLLKVDGSNLANTYSLRWNSTSEDTFEENDNQQAAAYLGQLDELDAGNVNTLFARNAVQFDADWYRVNIVASGRHYIEARIDFDSDQGELELELYNQQGNRIGVVSSETSPKTVSQLGVGNETYWIRVSGDNFGQGYILKVRNAGDDRFEENDILDQATDIRTMPIIPGSLVQNDDDFYLLSVSKDQVHLNIRIDRRGSEDLKATLYDLTLQEISSINLDDEFTGVWDLLISPDPKNYYLQISGDDIGTTYTLAWSTDDKDNYEENDSFTAAYNLTPVRFEPIYDKDTDYRDPITSLRFGTELGHATSTDEDWYQLQIPSWEVIGSGDKAKLQRIFNVQLEVQVGFEHDDGNIDLEVYDKVGNSLTLLASSTGSDDSEEILINVDPLNHQKTYLLRVFGDYAGNSYSLVWSAKPEDKYETNNFVYEAYPLYDETQVNTWLNEIDGYGTQATDDWYAVVASEGSTQLLVDCLYYSDRAANMNIDVYRLVGDSQRKPVLVGRFDGGATVIDPRAGDIDTSLKAYSQSGVVNVTGKPGIYFVRVYFDNNGSPYTFRWDDGVVADDSAIINDYTMGNWKFIPPEELPSALLIAPAANADGDAYPNWAEYALGLNPSIADYLVIGQSIATFEGERYFQFEYLRMKEAVVRGYKFIVEESTDMTFNGTGADFVRTESVDSDIERVIYRSTLPVADRDRCFFRLKVKEAPIK